MTAFKSGWIAAFSVALLWGLGPAIFAIINGDLIGQPFTDLYPSVWGMEWFASQQPGFPLKTDILGCPEGMGFYYSSPIHGFLAAPLRLFFSLTATWNILIVSARIASVLLSFAWLKAEGLKPVGALAGSIVFACAAMFHGYAVEGIVEGVDSWTFALWAMLAAKRKMYPAAFAFFLVIFSSWYLGMAAFLVALVRAREHRIILISAIAGSLMAIPFWYLFINAFPDASPLPYEIRALMGTTIEIPRPGILEGLNPFAKSSYIGWIATIVFLFGFRRKPFIAAGAVICWILSLGVGPWYDLPVFEMVRFPYRLVAATLALGAVVIGNTISELKYGWCLVPLILFESFFLSSVEPILPGASSEIPALYEQVTNEPMLDVPGPVSMVPGKINKSRPRSRYLLYFRTNTAACSPWKPDFNGVADSSEPEWLTTFRTFDPLEILETNVKPDLCGAYKAGVRQLLIHEREVGENQATRLEAALSKSSAVLAASDQERKLYILSACR